MDLIDTLNVLVKPTENFIEGFEKKFQLKTLGFVRIFQPDFGIHFQKISIFSINLMLWADFFFQVPTEKIYEFYEHYQTIWKVRLN